MHSLQLRDNNDGTYDGSYNVSKPGYYVVSISMAESPIKGSPFRVLLEAARSALSWADGPGLEGGQSEFSSKFTIHAVDTEGNPRVDGGDPFQVDISGPSQANPQTTDNNDGNICSSYLTLAYRNQLIRHLYC